MRIYAKISAFFPVPTIVFDWFYAGMPSSYLVESSNINFWYLIMKKYFQWILAIYEINFCMISIILNFMDIGERSIKDEDLCTVPF